MVKQILILGLILLGLNLSSCREKKIGRIGYGTSFGMCRGYCQSSLDISNSKLTFSKRKNGQPSDTKTCSRKITQQEVNEITAGLDFNKIIALPKVIGCPDCADGGAEYVMFDLDGKGYMITFEYGKAPKELETAVQKLKILKENFKDCN